jgi:hypothetical protein
MMTKGKNSEIIMLKGEEAILKEASRNALSESEMLMTRQGVRKRKNSEESHNERSLRNAYVVRGMRVRNHNNSKTRSTWWKSARKEEVGKN